MKCLAGASGLWVAAMAAALPVWGQAASGSALREIDDPHSGARWVLVRNEAHPGGPGRLVQLPAGEPGRAPGPMRPGETVAVVVIHPGEHVLVEEHTAIADVRLEGVALGTAVAGAPLQVRLKIGGRVVRAVALTRGRVALAAESEGPR